MNLADTVSPWLATLRAEGDASPRTISTYAEGARAYLAEGLEVLDSAGARVFLLRLAERGLTSATRYVRAAAIRSWARYLERAHAIEPVEVPSVRVAAKRLPRTLEPEQLRAVLDAPPVSTRKGLRDRAWLHVLARGGLRISELCGLNVEDYAEGAIRVRGGKGNKDRIVPLPPRAREAVDAWIAIRTAPPVERALFVSREGTRLPPRSATRILAGWCAWVGVPVVSPHALRHTYATALLRTGADIAEVASALGHSSIATTARYLHADPARLRAAVDRMERLSGDA